MIFVISLIPATVLVVVGYFVLFSSTRADGAMKAFGRGLAIWIFILAAAFPVAGGYATYAGIPSMDAMMQSMHPEGAPK
jgi:Mn2+/Fe2+ NRAMP family transporter